MKNKSYIRNMVLISLGAVLMAIGAWITIPFAIPFTMQTFVLYLLLDLYGGRRGSISFVLYLALGLVGIPVFSGFKSGIPALLGPTGGFLFGFLIIGLLYIAFDPMLRRFSWARWALPYVTMWLYYLCGALWYMVYFSEKSVGFTAAFSACVLPYIIPDCIKTALALLLSKRLKRIISV